MKALIIIDNIASKHLGLLLKCDHMDVFDTRNLSELVLLDYVRKTVRPQAQYISLFSAITSTKDSVRPYRRDCPQCHGLRIMSGREKASHSNSQEQGATSLCPDCYRKYSLLLKDVRTAL